MNQGTGANVELVSKPRLRKMYQRKLKVNRIGIGMDGSPGGVRNRAPYGANTDQRLDGFKVNGCINIKDDYDAVHDCDNCENSYADQS